MNLNMVSLKIDNLQVRYNNTQLNIQKVKFENYLHQFISSQFNNISMPMKNVKIGQIVPMLGNIGGILGNQTVNPKLKDGWVYAGFTPARELYNLR